MNNNKTHISRSDLPELIGQVIDIFEDFLEEKHVAISNPDREGDPDAAILYGDDYDRLSGQIGQTLVNWDIVSSNDVS